MRRAWEFVGGCWYNDDIDRGQPDAIVAPALVPSAGAGREGWIWWTNGRIGEASSLDEAKASALAALIARSGGA